ncbi:hypothetical protein KAU08_09540 [bacterium]|nr:hypothetical protein [bacterium]
MPERCFQTSGLSGEGEVDFKNPGNKEKTMKISNFTRIAVIFFLVSALMVLISCDQPEPVPAPVDPTPLAPDISQNIEIHVELQETLASPAGGLTPEALLFSVVVENTESISADSMGINFIYETFIPTGEKTFLLVDPYNPDSGYVSEGGFPVLFDVVETAMGRLEDWAGVDENTRQFYVTPPSDAFSIVYHVEVMITSEDREVVFFESPTVSVGDILAQGGVITELRD